MAQSDKEALNLYQLIGAPLLAVVQAEAQAAQVTAAFIQEVGFKPPPGGKPLQEGDSLGDLKIAKFGHKVRGIDGVTRDHTVEVPVLSLYPIPLLQVKDAEFDFAVKVLDHVSKGPELATQQATTTTDAASPPGLKEFLSQNRIEFKGAIAREHTADSTQHSSEMQLKVKIRMEQADVPMGLLKLFNLMDQTIQSTPNPPEGVAEAGVATAENAKVDEK